jgi:oxygen-independent coproporphyrinogen-3 oxidase
MTFRDTLAERMARPQRHRLLQGFPAVPAMGPAVPPGPGDDLRRPRRFDDEGNVRDLDGRLQDARYRAASEGLAKGRPPPLPLEPDTPEHREFLARVEQSQREQEARWRAIVEGGDCSEGAFFDVDASRDLIVGVIPHTQCVPRVEGCGFCTFPHDPARPPARAQMVKAVIEDIRHVVRSRLRGRSVRAIYLGGGTANLSSTEEIAALVSALAEDLRLGEAELTLEGTPQLFAHWFSSHLKNLAKQPVGTRRISMGIQTFDDGFLRLMGREKFGDEGTVRKLVKKCRELEMATSGDLLFNLPGQTSAQMDRDVDTAIAAGLDQICLYNLVLYQGLGTPWSKDESLVAQMRENDDACAQWLRLRERVLAAGYVQTTLTNFEREDVHQGPRRFRYEDASFSAERTDGIGFGPMSLTTFVNLQERRGLKLLRRKDLSGTPWSRGDLMFRYDADSLKQLQMTRGLAKTRLDGAAYAAMHGSCVVDDVAAPLTACVDAGLVVVDGDDLVLTPVGMFYADAVVSTLAMGATRPTGAGLHTSDLLREQPHAGEYYGMG